MTRPSTIDATAAVGRDDRCPEKFRFTPPKVSRQRFRCLDRERTSLGRVYRAMGYVIGVIILLIVPLLFILLSRRTSSAGGVAAKQRSRGVTVSKPSSDQPTPRADATNQADFGADQRLPPG
jgi:hypothetical protein